MDSNCAIVVVAYNRVNSLIRLLDSLNRSFYQEEVTLHISIDAGDNKDVLEAANLFVWKHGRKVVIYQEQNLGLRNHVIACGNLTEKYGSIILLEDDLFVSPYFYEYTKQAIEYYKDDDSIAGIALYSPRFNETAKEEFYSLKQNSDVYFMQLPCSWGQAWTHSQWNSFKSWYNKNEKINDNSEIPQNIISWPETSWKKYFAQYMLDQDKYFVYPYESFSTNFGEPGTHFMIKTNLFQVPLQSYSSSCFNFIKREETALIYDMYHENNILCRYFDKEISRNITIDLYGSKNSKVYRRYLLSSRQLNYKILQSFDDSLVPHELNIIYNILGHKIFLYDTSQVEVNHFAKVSTKSENYLMRFKNYYELLNGWMKLKNNNISLRDYFKLRGINTISIYGAGELGKRLYEEMKDSSIEVRYFIDNSLSKTQTSLHRIPIIDVLDLKDNQSIGTVVITVTYEFDLICEYINKINKNINILSLDKIIREIENINNLC